MIGSKRGCTAILAATIVAALLFFNSAAAWAQQNQACKRALFISDKKGLGNGNWYGYSKLKKRLKALRFQVREVNPKKVTSAHLEESDLIVLSIGWWNAGKGSAAMPDKQAQKIVDFVNSGKGLFLLGEVGIATWSQGWNGTTNHVGEYFGIKFNKDMICSSQSHHPQSDDPDGGLDQPIVSVADPFNPAITYQLLINWGSTLTTENPSDAVGFSDASSWQDKNCVWDNKIKHWTCSQGNKEPSGSFPVVAQVETATGGRVLALGDASSLVNGWIKRYDNQEYFERAFAWLGKMVDMTFSAVGDTNVFIPGADTVTFVTTVNHGPSISEINWDFDGDGQPDLSSNDEGVIVTPGESFDTYQVSHAYAAAGSYSVTCTVVETNGCRTVSNPIPVSASSNNLPTISSLTAEPTTGTDNVTVSFTCTAADPDGSIAEYRWSYGDGSSIESTTINAQTHFYSSPGVYQATCQVVDSGGATATSPPVTITVNASPTVSLTAYPVNGTNSLNVSFTCSANDPDGSIVEYRWSYGDGDTETSTSAERAHYYAEPGVFNATCQVVDNNGATAASSPVVIAVNASPAIDSLTANPSSGIAPLNVSFTCAAHDPDESGSIASYIWNFGNGQTQTTSTGSVQHAYGSPGEYSASCIAVDNMGAQSNSASTTVVVLSPNQPPVVGSFAADYTNGNAPLTVTFTCSATDPDGSIVEYRWNYGDGSSETSSTNTHVHVYAAGSFDATCEVVDDSGATAISSPLTISVNAIPTVSLSATPEIGQASLQVELFCSANDPEGLPLTYSWDFNGDGSWVDEPNAADASRLYAMPGEYSPRCRVMDQQGAIASSEAILITVSPNDWPQLGYGPERTSHNPFDRAINATNVVGLGQQFQIDITDYGAENNVESPLITANGRLLLTDSDGVLYAFDAFTGAPLWSDEPSQESYYRYEPSLAASNGVVYAVRNRAVGESLAFELSSFDALSGASNGEPTLLAGPSNMGSMLDCPLIISNNLVYAVSHIVSFTNVPSSYLRALNTKSQQLSSFSTVFDSSNGAIVVADNIVYGINASQDPITYYWNGALFDVEGVTGAPVGTVFDSFASFSPVFGLAAHNGALYVATGSYLRGYDPSTGLQTLGPTEGSGSSNAFIAIANGEVYVVSPYQQEGWTLLAYSAATGDLNWSISSEDIGSPGAFMSPPAVANGIIYVTISESASGHRLVAIDSATRAVVRNALVTDRETWAVPQASPIIANGRVYMSFGSLIFAYGLE